MLKRFEEMSIVEIETLLKGYTKSEINKMYNDIIGKQIKLTGTKKDYIDTVISLRRSVSRNKAFAKY